MKKINNINTYYIMLLSALMFIFVSAQFVSCKAPTKVNRTNGEVVLVDSTLMKSHPWEEAAFDITCVEEIDCENEDGFYWCIYNSPDQFDSVLCVSMDKKTYEALKVLYARLEASDFDYEVYERSNINRFHLYYGHCEETVLMFE